MTPTENEMRNVWLVIAAYNEQDRIAATLRDIAHRVNVVVVDDGSRDGTSEAANRFPIWLLRHPINCGQGAALQTGIEFALSRGAEAIVTFDADGQHDPADLPAMLRPVIDGEADVVLGSRFRGA